MDEDRIETEGGHMRYMLLIGSDDKNAPPRPRAEMEALVAGHRRFSDELQAAGKMVHGERLRPEGDASRVRLKAGQRQVMDGPFAETKEGLGGFYLIDCETRDEAVEWAKKLPLVEGGFVDVRPIWQM
ncbi:MAG TPA: YciI family protein [Candidatus Acidoferrum sp.]|nr:YciI family protein [Candidatus Acidoferrum sp.]